MDIAVSIPIVNDVCINSEMSSQYTPSPRVEPR
jgi:hypothetical protein